MCGQCAEDKPATDALTRNKFIQIKKVIMITSETLRAYEGPPAWNEHYHMVPLEVNIDFHYFKRLQTL